MPAPSPTAVLANPPPLTPRSARNFPYRLRPFPLDTLQQTGQLAQGRLPAVTAEVDPALDRVE